MGSRTMKDRFYLALLSPLACTTLAQLASIYTYTLWVIDSASRPSPITVNPHHRLEIRKRNSLDTQRSYTSDKMWKSILGLGSASQPPINNALTEAIPSSVYQQQTTVATDKLDEPNHDNDLAKLYVEAACRNAGCILEHDTAPCEGGISKLHKLCCGHYVYSETSVYCGSTCSEQPAAEINVPLYCLLCVRDDLARHRKNPPLRWHDLLLPSCYDQVGEAADLREYASVTRASEPAFVDGKNTVVLPRGAPNITLIRASEKHREEALAERIVNLLASDGYPEDITDAATENLNYLLCNHQYLRYVDLAVVASICIMLTLEFEEVKEVKYENVAAIVSAPDVADANIHVVNGCKILTNFVVQDKIDACLRRLPRKYRQDRKFQKTKLDEAARRIRVCALRRVGFTSKQRRVLFNYIIAACVQQGLAQLKIHATMQEICEAMDIDYVGEPHETSGGTTQFPMRALLAVRPPPTRGDFRQHDAVSHGSNVSGSSSVNRGREPGTFRRAAYSSLCWNY